MSVAKVFWTLLILEAIAFLVLTALSFRSGTRAPEGLVGAWILIIPPIILAVLAWLFQHTESPHLRGVYTALLVFPLVLLLVGPVINQFKLAVWERGWRGADYFSSSVHRDFAGAIYDHDAARVKELLPGVGDLNQSHGQGMTLFDYAMSNTDGTDASFDIVQTLLAAGADPNVPAGRPLSLALYRGTRFTTLLLDAGANPDATESSGRPVWWNVLSSSYDEDLTLLNLLLERGVDIHRRDREGGPVGWAAYNKAWRAMKLLMERGAAWKGEQQFGTTVHQLLLIEEPYQREAGLPEFHWVLAKYEAEAATPQ